ncbi:hypothetical protein Ahy_A02g008887 [Arachis hypogaea]|uniref:RNase H type-1 domain-containing protein n=1 Tax=Arachis hypogaea TaxID=3818 RepID=A0A445EFR1_ARAHY|nr:hypothetical protein Ahy_A02g008887 [Arachis hypogaea]
MDLEKDLAWKRVIKEKSKVEYQRWFQSKHMDRQLDHWEEQKIYKEIFSTPISIVNKEDYLHWPWNEDGNYSIRTGYYVAKKAKQDMRYGNLSTSEDKKKIWKDKAYHDILPVGSNLYKRKMVWRQSNMLYCYVTGREHHGSAADCQWTPTVETINSIGSWMVKCIRKIRAGGGEDQEKRIKVNRSRINPVRWRPPPETWLKANVNATFRKDNRTSVIVVVIRDSKGRIVLGFLRKIQANSNTVVEAHEIRQALIIVNNLQMGRTLIEFDNTAIGEALAIIQDIQILVENLPEKGMTWTPKNENRLAHVVTKAAKSETLCSRWSSQPPANIQNNISSEVQI